MSKRKKLRTSGEGIRPPKHPKLRDSDEDPPSFQFGPSGHPEESKSRSGPVPCTEQSEEESGQEASSSLDKEPGAPCRLLSQAEKEPIPFPPSQNSDRRFVPQFAKPRKTVTRLTTAREEDLGSGAFSSICTSPHPIFSTLHYRCLCTAGAMQAAPRPVRALRTAVPVAECWRQEPSCPHFVRIRKLRKAI
ncbi:break repair meiotic recombinase recruitment factor 1 isoform X2 [Pipistrellus kuhlii]|uniref:break repair meiotic recombinase recruitment factor 1 isoform X2 n=1 Tax=Pipistrellus kuhlii TaxID=59472 RepID=UPI001E26FE0A|nr:break repair meiotic recombinase recruitment factor 1 isoform X2 [Pipistrellus kuhlii]